jgi:hypothetical protein
MSWLLRIFKRPPVALQASHNNVKARFTYIDQTGEWKNEKTLTATLIGPIVGDCDDWAASVAYLSGGEYAQVTLPDGGRHAVCIFGGWVSDNMVAQPYQRKCAKWVLRQNFKLGSVQMKALGYKLKVK